MNNATEQEVLKGSVQQRSRAFFIDGEDVEAALGDAGRAYLVGHLFKPQRTLDHIGSLDSTIEVGTTRYDRPTVDQAHLHTWNTDISVVLSGLFAVRILSTGETRFLRKGGVCVLEPGVPHICIASAGTQVLFVKSPGGNDKTKVELDDDAQQWIEETLKSL